MIHMPRNYIRRQADMSRIVLLQGVGIACYEELCISYGGVVRLSCPSVRHTLSLYQNDAS